MHSCGASEGHCAFVSGHPADGGGAAVVNNGVGAGVSIGTAAVGAGVTTGVSIGTATVGVSIGAATVDTGVGTVDAVCVNADVAWASAVCTGVVATVVGLFVYVMSPVGDTVSKPSATACKRLLEISIPAPVVLG